jgi:hypothetical protein
MYNFLLYKLYHVYWTYLFLSLFAPSAIRELVADPGYGTQSSSLILRCCAFADPGHGSRVLLLRRGWDPGHGSRVLLPRRVKDPGMDPRSSSSDATHILHICTGICLGRGIAWQKWLRVSVRSSLFCSIIHTATWKTVNSIPSLQQYFL